MIQASAQHATVFAQAGRAHGVAFVRPFASWLVRHEAAAGEIGTMSEIAGAGQSALRAVRPDAFESMPPALYVYRQSTAHGEHVGIVCDVMPEAFLDGRVLGHESVQPDQPALPISADQFLRGHLVRTQLLLVLEDVINV